MIEVRHADHPELTFTCRVSGPGAGPLVMFLHGFPETSHMWIPLMEFLGSKGFFCVAPNLRGYSPHARPGKKIAYHLDLLSGDVLGIAKSLGYECFHLVGHDWGAAIGWKTAHDYPQAIGSWTGLSVPHLQAFGEAIATDPQQRRMSRYMKFFQWPYLPEWQMRRNNFALLKKIWRESSPDEIQDYLEIFGQKGALTAALNYYRANFSYLKKADKECILGKISVPTLFIWGEKDFAIGPMAVENSHKMMDGPYQFLNLSAGHWLVQTREEAIRDALLKHLLQNPLLRS